MNQNGYEPMNRNEFAAGTPGAGQPLGYSAPSSGFPNGYTNPGVGNPYGYSAPGYYSGGQGQAGGFQPVMSNSQSYNMPAQNQFAGLNSPNAGFAPQPGYGPQNGYPTGSGYFAQPANGTVNGGFASPAGGYGVNNPQPIPMTGSFIPQTPYSPGYTSPGYQQPSAPYLQQGNNAYAQMGRNTQTTPAQEAQNRQMPLNGGGYVPQHVPVRRGPFELKDFVLIIAGSVLAVLCITGLLLGNSPAGIALKICFIVLAAATTAIFWIKPMTAQNKRLCYTIIAASLITVALLSFLVGSPKAVEGKPGATATPPLSSGTQTQQNGSSQSESVSSNGSGTTADQSVTTAPPAATNEAADRLGAFLTYWGGNRIEEMLTLCAPSWMSKQENPKNELFSLLQNRTPKEFMLENITGTDADSSRQITMKIKIDRNNGKPAVVYRMTVLMLKESGEWYVDPKSLQSNEVDVTPDPNVTPTQAPTPEPYVDANTVLYYNPDGGELYHLDQNCRIINARYLPLKGHFTYGQINESPYSELKPCNVCGAPLKK